MYIIKISREPHSFMFNSKVWSKEWSEELNSHIIDLIDEKRVFSSFIAKRWANKVIANDLFLKNKLVILHG